MRVKCPGNLQSDLKSDIFKCSVCFYDVEIFSDEISVKCPNCGTEVTREKIPSCIDWCPAAKECVGMLKWQEIKKGRVGKKNESKKKNHSDR